MFRGRPRNALLDQREVLRRLTSRLLGQEEQVDEDLDLGLQDLGHDRGCDVIDRAEGVALLHVMLVVEVGGDEDDRDMRRPAAIANQRRGFEAVQARHVDVEQNHREVALEHLLQRLLARRGRVQILPKILEDRPVDKQLVRAIVDDEDVGAAGRRRFPKGVCAHIRGYRFYEAISRAMPAAHRPSIPYRPAWRDSPTLPPPCISPDRPSSPWRSPR